MLSFRFCSLETPIASIEALACWELAAFFIGSASIEDVPLDRDIASDWYIENLVLPEERADYRAEQQLAEDEMLDYFSSELASMARQRIDILGENYPFSLDGSGSLVRVKQSQVSFISVSYIILQFYRALRANLIEIDGANNEDIRNKKQKFNRIFYNLLEYIAGLTVSGKQSGVPFMLSDCRSAERLHRILSIICKKIGSGRVRRFDDWGRQHRETNDGKVDCLVYVGDPQNSGSAHIELVSATAQESNIDIKIMGRDKLEFFSGFFAEKPAAFRGALVRPQDADELTLEKCKNENCLLFTYGDIISGLSKHGVGRRVLQLSAKARGIIEGFNGIILSHEYVEYACIKPVT